MPSPGVNPLPGDGRGDPLKTGAQLLILILPIKIEFGNESLKNFPRKFFKNENRKKVSQQKIEKNKKGKMSKEKALVKNFSRNFLANQNIFIYLCQKLLTAKKKIKRCYD